MTTEAKTCCGSTWTSRWINHCHNKGKVERDGKWYCGIHDPVAVKKKRDERNAVYAEERKEAQSRIDARVKAEAEMARRAGCVDDLLDALQGVLRVADRATVEFDAARAAIAKAIGEN